MTRREALEQLIADRWSRVARLAKAPPRVLRALLASGVGVLSGWFVYRIFVAYPALGAKDWTYQWRAGRMLLLGLDPYQFIRPLGDYPYESWYMYPFTATLATLPFAFLPAKLSGAIFVALGAAALAYAVSRDGIGRLWILLGAPFVVAVSVAQWTPLLVAAALLTPLGWALACKPTLGAVLFLYRPRWSVVALGLALVALAFAVHPHWLGEWIRNTRQLPWHPAPVLQPFGWVPLLALLRWRKPEARLVAALPIVPQVMYFYDQLPLMLVARSGGAAFGFAALSWVAWLGAMRRCGGRVWCGDDAEPLIIALLYVPATLYVLIDRDTIRAARERIASLRHRRAVQGAASPEPRDDGEARTGELTRTTTA